MTSGPSLDQILRSRPPGEVVQILDHVVKAAVGSRLDTDRVIRLLVERLFRHLEVDDQLAVLRAVTDGESSGLSPEVRIEAIEAHRAISAEVAAVARAGLEVVNQKLLKRNRQPDPETLRFVEEVVALKGSLAWSKVAEVMVQRHPLKFGYADGVDRSEVMRQAMEWCRKNYTRYGPGKRRAGPRLETN